MDRETHQRMNEDEKVEVKVGGWLADGTFTGTLVRFSGEALGDYTDYSEASSSDDRGTTYTLYRTPDGNYRVHVEVWSRWQGEGSEAWLLPQGYPATEEEAREEHAHLFAAVGTPNVVDLDGVEQLERAEQEQLEREISGNLTPADEEMIDMREERLRAEALRRRRESGEG